ncbi:MAG TPA: MFS transporter, partial [Armatimonadota bacterium]|nr:MFS transporter [Armatimonadota bacterium]
MRPRDLRWNFGAALIDTAGWGVGMGLISPGTILPVFVGHLSQSPLYVGLIQAVQLFGWLVPGVLVSGWVERLPRVKFSVIWIAALERSMLLLLVPLCLWLGPAHRTALLAAFFACWFVMNAAVGANTPGYYKLIAKTIPAQLRGRLYGIGGALSGVVGVPVAGLLAAWFLGGWGFPAGYAACFFTAAVVQALTVAPLAFMREPVQPEHAAPEPMRPAQVLRLARRDSRLLWVSGAVALFSLNTMAGAFYTVYAVERFHAADAAVAGFTAVVMGARVIAFLLAGWLGDRHGNRAALVAATLAGVAAAALAAWAPALGWLYVVFTLNEIAVQGWGVCSMNYVLELCPPERSSSYTAVFGLLTGPLRVLAPLLGGWMAGGVGYAPVFGLAALGAALALLLLLARLP